jgi:hypothetical protein
MPSTRSALFSLSFTLVAAAAAIPVEADTLVLQSGRRVQGTLISVARGWVEFQPLAGAGDNPADRLRVAVAEVRTIRFDDVQRVSNRTLGDAAGSGNRADPQEAGVGRRDRRRVGDAGGGVSADRHAPSGEPDTTFGREGTPEVGDDPLDEDDDVAIGVRQGGPAGRSVRDDRRGGRMITVSATQRWTNTGIDVATGDVISFSVAGTVGLGDDRPLGAEGDPDGAAVAPRRPLPDRPAGALIGRIGTSPDDTFFIGAERLPFRVRTSGRLYLGVNDDSLDDDSGAFQVAVSR